MRRPDEPRLAIDSEKESVPDGASIGRAPLDLDATTARGQRGSKHRGSREQGAGFRVEIEALLRNTSSAQKRQSQGGIGWPGGAAGGAGLKVGRSARAWQARRRSSAGLTASRAASS